MSWWVPLSFGYQLFGRLAAGGQSLGGLRMLEIILQLSASEAILLLTVLCHEFGHGNMARYLGGSIDHILLWVFGGICFSTRPSGVYEPKKILKNDLLIVAAGPATHVPQATFWGLILALLFVVYRARASQVISDPLYFSNPWEAFIAALNPHPVNFARSTAIISISIGKWSAVLWGIIGQAVSTNVMLFLFNVFFPMYPADGSKLLVTSLMYCSGMAPRRAAKVLLCVSVPCALLMLGYMAYNLYVAFTHITGVQSASLMNSMMGLMALMSLQESWRIYQLMQRKQLWTHPLFQTARNWQRANRDQFGVVHRINNSEQDDETPPFFGGCRDVESGCALFSCICPCLRPKANYVPASGGQLLGGIDMAERSQNAQRPLAGLPAASIDVRAQRGSLLDQIEQQGRELQKDVGELSAERGNE